MHFVLSTVALASLAAAAPAFLPHPNEGAGGETGYPVPPIKIYPTAKYPPTGGPHPPAPTYTPPLGGPHPPAPTGTGHPQPPPITTHPTPEQPGYTTITRYHPTTVTGTLTSFVPCSTLLPGDNGGHPVYSTYLTPTYVPTTYVSTRTDVEVRPTGGAGGEQGACPPAATVTATVTVYAHEQQPAGPTPCPGGPRGCGHYETHTYTSTLPGGEVTTIVVPPKDHGNGGNGGHGTGIGPKPTGDVHPGGHGGNGGNNGSDKPTGTGHDGGVKPTGYNPPKPTGSAAPEHGKRGLWFL